MSRLTRALVVVAAVLAGLAAIAPLPAPAGAAYVVESKRGLGAQVDWATMRRGDPKLFFDVAHVAPGAPVRLVPVLSNDKIAENPPAGRTELTSSMCRRVDGLVCVNADFPICQTCGEPFGAFIAGGEPVRSPNKFHEQLSVAGGKLTTAKVELKIKLVAINEPPPPPPPPPADPDLEPIPEEPPPEPEVFELPIDELNRPSAHGITLFNHRWGTTTQSPADATELVMKGLVPKVGKITKVTPMKIAAGNQHLWNGQLVFTARGKGEQKLQAFYHQVRTRKPDRIELRITSSLPADLSLGGHPVILRGGNRVPQNPDDGKISNRHPRTLIGWNAAGDVWIVVVDGRRPGHSVGVTMAEAADLLEHLGATEGLNLDGGGSSAFVTAAPCTNGQTPCVHNLPSDGRERKVSSALAVVPNDPDVTTAAARGPTPAATTTIPALPAPVVDEASAVAPPPPPPPPPTTTVTTAAPKPTTTTTEAVKVITTTTASPPPTLPPQPIERALEPRVVDDEPPVGPAAAVAALAILACLVYGVRVRRR